MLGSFIFVEALREMLLLYLCGNDEVLYNYIDLCCAVSHSSYSV